MRIGFVTPFLTRSGGGVFTSALCLARSLAADDLRIFGLEDPAAVEDLATWQPLRVDAFPVRGPRSFGYAPALREAVRKAPLDIVHLHGLWTYPSVAAHRSGKPTVISPHGMLDPWALAHSRWKKKLAGAVFQNAPLRHAACLHALCASEAEAIRAYGLSNPICVIPNGIEVPSPSSQPAPWADRVPSSAKVLLYLGRLHPKKGLPNLLRAWALAARPDWHLVIAGWDQGRHERELQRLAAEVHASQIHFVGPQFGTEKAASYLRADAFILPSLSEGLPMVILEAWAHGKPVVMTEACNLPEGFAHDAAIRVTPETESIMQGLRQLTALSAEELSEMGKRGRLLVAQRFSWPKIAAEFHAVYQWILHGGRQPACIQQTA